ncbi:MAG: putative membrane protein [Parcubacteria bacterium C7867-008]|nr:MAG: putative membrane protein [Parcubacteria bacterium C7867-008]
MQFRHRIFMSVEYDCWYIHVIADCMIFPNRTRVYEQWAPVIARIILGAMFLMGASFKIPGTGGFGMETQMTADAGVPFAMIAVLLAFIIEVVAGLCLVVGYHAREAAFILAGFTLILAFVFYRNFADPMTMGQFVSHLGLIAGLIYVSVYGAQHVAVRRDLILS